MSATVPIAAKSMNFVHAQIQYICQDRGVTLLPLYKEGSPPFSMLYTLPPSALVDIPIVFSIGLHYSLPNSS